MKIEMTLLLKYQKIIIKGCAVVKVLIAFKVEYLIPICIGFALFAIYLNSP